MAKDHIKQLTAARKKLVAERHKHANSIAAGKTARPSLEKFIVIQRAIGAIDNALHDERHMTSEGKPAILAPMTIGRPRTE